MPKPAWLAGERAVARLDRGAGGRHQRDLLRATDGRGIYRDGHGGAARGGRAAGNFLFVVQRSRQPLLADAEGWGAGRPAAANAGGVSAARVGHRDDSRVFAAKTGNVEMWLPQSAELYSDWRGKRMHRRHSFSNYILFSVDEKQRISEPKT